jgi:hypothetical protein
MNTITVHRLSLQFDADQITLGSPEEQARQAVDLINASLHRDLFGLSAQLIATRDEIEIESDCEACAGVGWITCSVGDESQIQRCDA